MRIHDYKSVPEVKCVATVNNCKNYLKQPYNACEISKE